MERGTTTAELLRLHEWLSHAACTHVASGEMRRRRQVENYVEGANRSFLG